MAESIEKVAKNLASTSSIEQQRSIIEGVVVALRVTNRDPKPALKELQEQLELIKKSQDNSATLTNVQLAMAIVQQIQNSPSSGRR